MTFNDHFSSHAGEYAKARPDYPAELFEWLASLCTACDLAWDCATGNGQAAIALARHFERVIATDASDKQIANASPHPNVEYRVAAAEDSGLQPASVDLVTVAQALHWFDQARFHDEARRVLKPGGVIAAWCYHFAEIDADVDCIMRVFEYEVVGEFWPPERKHIDAHYQDLPFPFERIAMPEFRMIRNWTRAQFLAYVATWSAVQRYRERRGHDPMAWLENELDAFWLRDEVRRVTWRLFGLVGLR